MNYAKIKKIQYIINLGGIYAKNFIFNCSKYIRRDKASQELLIPHTGSRPKSSGRWFATNKEMMICEKGKLMYFSKSRGKNAKLHKKSSLKDKLSLTTHKSMI